ncbi:hypothetical protein AWU67_12680 [Microterricola viridarii]|uniref:Glycosyltransferase 2-like domain-containing protein n=2 Tax=Microterricola viridarii TaxID=412690 RepID=A0A109QX96_9MICO|nr:hypothetical protein AWU67_12680 [Microterricola viridarii]
MGYLAALIESIVTDGPDSLELVLSDDNSTDPAPIRELLESCSVPWTAIWSTEALGMVSNWNRAAAQARGAFTLVTGQDDLVVGRNLSRAINAAQESHAGLVLSAPQYVSSTGTITRNPSKAASADRVFDEYAAVTPSPDALVTAALLYGNVLGDPCHTFFSTVLFRDVGGFSAEYEHAVDLELWLRMLATDPVVLRVPYEIGAHRQHAAAATGVHVRDGSAQRDRQRLVDHYGSAMSIAAWNRAVARLHTHRLNDRIRHQTPMQPLTALMRGRAIDRVRAWTAEALESAGLRKPMLERYVRAVPSAER